MNWDQLQGKWKQLKGTATQKWAKFTDDDWAYISGSKDRFIGKIQEHYGSEKEQAQRDVEAWLAGQDEPK